MNDAFKKLQSLLSGCECLMEDLQESIKNLNKTLEVVGNEMENIKWKMANEVDSVEQGETD
jgi:hypothetical protein